MHGEDQKPVWGRLRGSPQLSGGRSLPGSGGCGDCIA